jgi:stage III sporulation protein AE
MDAHTGGTKSRRAAAPLLLALAAALLLTAAAPAAAQTTPGLELFDELDLNFFDRYWSELEKDVQEYLPGLSWRKIMDSLQSGEAVLEPAQVIGGLGRFFAGEVMLNLKLTGQLLLLVVAAAFLKNLESAFEREQVAALTRGIVFIVLAGVCLQSFRAAMEVAGGAINNMADFTMAMLPTLLALLAAQGSLASSAMLHPLVVFGISFFATAIRSVIFPLIFFSAILGLANHFSPHFKVGKLSDFLRDLSIWGMCICMTVFTGILAVQGAAGTVADAVTLRTAKYMTGAFVPVVGKMLSDAVETVAGASIILKNGVYLAGVVVLLLLTAFPLLKLAAVTVVFKLSAALVQPLGETNLGDCINTMGNCLALLLGALASVAVIFFLAVTVIVGAGNVAIMFR